MTAYTVTASNRHFWMSLAVDAHDPASAAAAFRRFLAATKSGEEEEFQMAKQADIACDRSDYEYDFDDADVEPYDGEPTADVQFIRSGPNG